MSFRLDSKFEIQNSKLFFIIASESANERALSFGTNNAISSALALISNCQFVTSNQKCRSNEN
ncbi:MAG: hypothetical protein US25_C0003G0010 [Candidatus Moranbacteria bacterium GW2011_GWE1_36_7]|nr:MAG: hypothetical protein UR99_C0014G0010 [Candidatus Moranbacteria bacterium GW2011_GWD2_36_12]KKQ06442.1 MAG: hypothetical protein US16_C0017G0010 [Candidatus Moranbacteria bacterium GW2011_GWE2_36_40]KKQ15492.1 MAG: hypothetical protein US25_C0003G0010 [Candidatus Moranbacteria bacterium GW2011_GWE1_36_7]